MKRLARRLPIKILCFLLCVISLCASAIGICATAIMVNEDFYTKTADEVFADEIGYELRAFSQTAVDYLANGKSIPAAMSSPSKTNVRYRIEKPKHILCDTNMLASGSEVTLKNGRYYNFEVYVTENNGIIYVGTYGYNPNKSQVWTVTLGVTEELAANDGYAQLWELISLAHSVRYAIIPASAIALLLFIVFFIVLMCASGRRADSEEVRGGILNRIPFDLLVAVSGTTAVLGILLIDEASRSLSDSFAIALAAVYCFAAVCALIGLCMSFAARLKQGSLLKNTVVFRALCLLWRIAKWLWKHIKRFAKRFYELILGLPVVWRTLAVLVAVFIIDLVMLVAISNHSEELTIFLLFGKTAILGFFALFVAIYMRRLQTAGEALAKGDLTYQVNTEKMYYDFKKHGENLNRISAGMAVAVDERLHSERMKAELITNVSHDIKTPLTSIINYAGLIAESKCENEKHEEYSEVLLRKSEHLKRLLDDLVEISKANSGTLDVALLPCDANVLLQQAAGEFEQKCASAELELITSIPEKSIRIMADSRRIWRVFENLMNNAVKYSLPHSRVYLSLESDGGKAKFIFRNTSRESLNISPAELTERFVRGDASRSSEGSGLGLSIAKSLTELQKGEMDISIDGDLFKVVLSFPII